MIELIELTSLSITSKFNEIFLIQTAKLSDIIPIEKKMCNDVESIERISYLKVRRMCFEK